MIIIINLATLPLNMGLLIGHLLTFIIARRVLISPVISNLVLLDNTVIDGFQVEQQARQI